MSNFIIAQLELRVKGLAQINQLLLHGLLEQQHVICDVVAQVFCEVMTLYLFCTAKLALDESARAVTGQVLRFISAQQ